MVESDDKLIDAVTKLIRLTKEGILVWHSEPPQYYLRGDANDFVINVFTSQYNDWNLRLYKNIYKVDFNDSVVEMWDAETQPRTRLDFVVILEVVDEEGNALWAFPRIPALKDLLATVAYHVADIKGLLDNLNDSEIQIKKRIPGQKRFPETEQDG